MRVSCDFGGVVMSAQPKSWTNSSRADLEALIKADIEAEQASIRSEPTKKEATHHAAANLTGEPEFQEQTTKVYSCREFLAIHHENTTPLIGKDGDAFSVRGEGITIVGEGGIGKTSFLNQMACHLATGENFLKWQVQKPLRVIIYQAELPPPYFQKRLRPLFEVYALADPEKARMIEENVFVVDVKAPFDISGEIGGFEPIISDIKRLKIDVVIIDPFLSFFRGNENDNGEVRRALDSIKKEIAEKLQCGLVITDHMPKYSSSTKNPEMNFAMRGASAKRDWAASVLALTKMKTPDGQHGTFITATVDKMRYGKVPKNPFSIRRDDFSFRHDLVKNNDIPLHDIARILDEAGNDLPKRKFNQAVSEAFSISDHEARKLIEDAINEKWIVTLPGERRAIIHNLGERYFDYRNDL